jgi:hypothetical protein
MGISWKVVVKTRTVVDIEMAAPSVQHKGYGTDYADLFQLISVAKAEYSERTGIPSAKMSDNDIQVFVGDDKIVLRFWIEKEE